MVEAKQLLGSSASYIDNLQTAILMLAGDLAVLDLNSAAENMLGMSARQLIGRPIREAWINADEFRERLSSAITNQAALTQHDVLVVTGAAPARTYSCAITPVTVDSHGDCLLIEFTITDASPAMIRDAEMHSLRQVSDGMLRGFAHEVKNPLGGLRGAAQLLERELPSEELREYTSVILSEADRLANLVDRMLARNAAPEMTSLNLHEILDRVHALVSAELPTDVQIYTNYDPSIPEIMGDLELLIQGFLNIVRNAMQALGETGKGGEITLKTRVKRNMTIGTQRHRLVARVDITDTGPGVPADLQDQIFYPLITGRAEGTGLGLPIAQSLISQQGGLVSFTSRPGRTVFSVYLPITDQN